VALSAKREDDISMNSKTSPEVLVIHLSPLVVELFCGDELQVSLNERSLLHFDSHEVNPSPDKDVLSRKLTNDVDVEAEDLDRHQGKVVVDYGEDGESG